MYDARVDINALYNTLILGTEVPSINFVRHISRIMLNNLYI